MAIETGGEGVRTTVTRIGVIDLALLGLLLLGFVGAAIGMLAALPILTLVGVVTALGIQVAVTLRRSPINRALSFLGITRASRILLLVALIVLLEAEIAFAPSPGHLRADAVAWIASPLEVLIAVAAALCYIATLADQWRARGYRAGGLAWRGLGAFGLSDSERPPTGTGTALLSLVPAALLCIGVPAAIVGGGGAPAVIAFAVASLAASVVSCVASIVQRHALRGVDDRAAQLATLQRALDAYAPEVIIFFTAPASGTYALNVWMETAAAFTSRTLIMSMEGAHLLNVEPTSIPFVVAPRARDVEYLTVASVRVVLHPTTGNKAFRIMRLRGLSQIFIGHGDSDKVSSFNPYTRIFDEIWVSGPAGIDRYTALGEGFREEQFRAVGRPQLAEIATVAADGTIAATTPRPTVLYAPTWEGFLEQSNYSSLATMGVAMVRAMLAMDAPPRILFKPHPSSGYRRPDMLMAQDEIARLLTEAGADHEVYGAGTVSLYAAFNNADIMITDISSVVTDFLASHKPYLITNPRSEKLEDFVTAFPSASAGSVIDADLSSQQGPGFVPAIEHGLGGDPEGRLARIALSDYLLGVIPDDPVRAFAEQVTAAVERARVRYPGDRVVPRAFAAPDEAAQSIADGDQAGADVATADLSEADLSEGVSAE